MVAVMITVEVPVACGGADHRVILNIDGLGRIRCVQADHDQRAESVLEVLGGAPTACCAAKRATTRLRSAVPKAIERARWVRVGVRDLDDLDAWRNAGVRKPGIAEHWLTFTDRDLVVAWRGRGFRTPGQAGPWARAGFDPGCAQLWVKAGKTTEDALAWTAHGIASATSAAGWGWLGVESPEETEPWVRAGVVSGSEAEVWARLDVRRPTDVRRWLRAGAVDAEDAAAWVGFGVSLDQAPSQIREWRRAGAVSGQDAAAWWRAGAECAELSHWRADGVENGRELLLWRALGVESRKDLRRWRAAGVEDTEDAKAWVKAGVRCREDLVSWRAAGVRDGREALTWVWPPFVGSHKEVAAWKAAGVTDSDEARRRLSGVRLTESVLRARIEGFRRLNPNGGRPGEVGPARTGACPTAVTTERYFYAFSRPCRPDVATDVIEVDFDADGNEVSRSPRPVININREGSRRLQRFLLNPSPEVLLRVETEHQEESIDAQRPREEQRVG